MNDSFLDWHLVYRMQLLSSLNLCNPEGETMHSCFAFWLSGLLFLSSTLAGSATFAQNQHPIGNVFFGFDFILQPLAIKWACGGQRDQDLSQIEALVVVFPEDAERAELRPMVATLSETASVPDSLPQVLGAELNRQQVDQLCAAALPLNIDWVTPEQFIMGDESGIPDEQEAAWANFFRAIEDFQ
jgi:hypothetical protein